MEFLLILVGAVAVTAVFVLAFRAGRRPVPTSLRGPRPFGDGEVVADGGRVVLDMQVEDTSAPAVQRLAMDAAQRALSVDASLDRVIVVDRTGALLLEHHRAAPPQRDVTIPEQLRSHGTRGGRTPSATGHEGEWLTGQPQGLDADERVPRRPFAERFSLPESARDLLTDHDHPAAVIEAILRASGRAAERHGDLVRSDDVALVIADVADGADEALTRAYLRFQSSGAAHGVIVRLGYADPETIRRRDAASPQVRFTDSAAIQRMADAAALGLDPLIAAVGPPVTDKPALG